jgi:hypothetical protein
LAVLFREGEFLTGAEAMLAPGASGVGSGFFSRSATLRCCEALSKAA